MTWDLIERKWDEMARRVQTQWTQLTPHPLAPQTGAAPGVTRVPEASADAKTDPEAPMLTRVQMR